MIPASPDPIAHLAAEMFGTTDDDLALEFAVRHAARLRYVALWGRWMRWEATVWREDTTLAVFDAVRQMIRGMRDGVEERNAARLLSAQTVSAVERLAKSDRRLAATVDQWDADPMLLGTPAGVVDLRTGELRTADPLAYLTKRTAVAPGGEAPRWRAFLREVTNDDPALEDYLQRLVGYALTGSIQEHALAFFYGTGGNGKGVFLNTLTGVFGDYAKVASMDTFTAAKGDRHPADLAMLRGARLVTAQETEAGAPWAEARVKALTGGDPITARFMRQDFFTFTPTFKLLVAGNHKPTLRGVDEAMRRRLHLIPFTRQIPADSRDPMLPERLREEWPGILRWAIDGCLAWQEHGLAAPAAVLEATSDYFATEDAIQRWMDECCRTDPAFAARSGDLFASWRSWADANGERVGSNKALSQELAKRGFAPSRTRAERRILGIALQPRAMEHEEPRAA